MGISGNFSTVGLPDVLQLLSSGAKTGTLEVNRGSDTTHLYFKEGNIIYATSSTKKESLLNILVRGGRISTDHAEEVRRKTRSGKLSLEEVLQQDPAVSDEMLMMAANTQAKDIVYELFQWLEGEFEFKEDQLPPGHAQALSLSLGAYNLIMEGSRRIDEWSRIRKLIPSMDVVFNLEGDPDSGDIQFDKDEWKILALINGRRTVREICQEAGKSEFDVCRTLYGLKSAGLIESTGRRNAPVLKPRKKTMSPLAMAISAGAVVVVLTASFFGFIAGQNGSGKQDPVPPATQMAAADPAEIAATIHTPPRTGGTDTELSHVAVSPDDAGAAVPTGPAGNPEEATAGTPPPPTEPPATPMPDPPPDTASQGWININTASAETLTELPRVGPSTAGKIIEYRETHGPFTSADQIKNVPGIGAKTYERMKDMITVGDTASAPPQTRSSQTASSRTAGETAAEPRTSAASSSGHRVNLNTAGLDDLTTLPGIGPSKAQRIIDYRTENGPFNDPHDIVNIKGIGEKTYSRLKEQITVK